MYMFIRGPLVVKEIKYLSIYLSSLDYPPRLGRMKMLLESDVGE